MMKKLLIVIVLVGLGLALLSGSANAQTYGGISFGIRPTKAFEDRPETLSYFFHELMSGAFLTDEALVMNDGDVPLILNLYAADGITAQNGGTAFTKKGQESTGASRGVSRWLSLSVTEIPLEPGEEMIVPFTINVPSDASPGQYVAGLVAEAPPSGEAIPTNEGETQFAVKVVRRVGVAVVIDVPGPRVIGLEIEGASLKQQDDQGATFAIAIQNTGNIFLKAEGSLLIADRNGEELTSIPLKMDTVLPGDATFFHVTHPVHLADGDYLLTVTLSYEGETAILEGAEINVKDGQAVVESDPGEGTLSLDIIEIFPVLAEESLLPSIGRYAIYAAVLLSFMEVVLIISILRNRRRAKYRK